MSERLYWTCAWLLLFIAPAQEVRASCRSTLDDAVNAAPCLLCPCFFVPAFFCAEAGDQPEVWQFLGNSGRCCCRAVVGQTSLHSAHRLRAREQRAPFAAPAANLDAEAVLY